jgi:hypothetical protein
MDIGDRPGVEVVGKIYGRAGVIAKDAHKSSKLIVFASLHR